jgi:predicted aldo/keto reductase-like oxidoreductase
MPGFIEKEKNVVLINRRRFLKIAGTGALGLGIPESLKLNPPNSDQGEQETSTPKVRKYNRLGKTGLDVSDIGFGAINYFNPNVLRYAFDLGVNYFDTAEAYMRTMSETYLGQTLKDVRHQIILSTKHAASAPREMERNSLIQRIEGSLKRLQTDYLDIALIHQVSDPDVIRNEEVLAAYDRMKKDGKVRFTGFSTHVADILLPPLLETAVFDVVLFVYNHMEGPPLEPLIEKARAKGIGMIAMKALAGNKQGSLKSLVNEETKYSRAALGWILSNPHIDSCLITMNTFSHVEEYVAASGKPISRNILGPLAKYRREAGQTYCRVSCRDCLEACPHGVAINDVLRCAMYYEDYRMERGAVDLYEELAEGQKATRCGGCSAPCEGACPFGLPIKERLLQAHRWLSA